MVLLWSRWHGHEASSSSFATFSTQVRVHRNELRQGLIRAKAGCCSIHPKTFLISQPGFDWWFSKDIQTCKNQCNGIECPLALSHMTNPCYASKRITWLSQLDGFCTVHPFGTFHMGWTLPAHLLLGGFIMPPSCFALLQKRIDMYW